MMAQMTEIFALSPTMRDKIEYGLREVYVNPSSIAMIRSEPSMRRRLTEGKLPEGIDDRVEFSRVSISSSAHSSSIVVVGTPQMIQEKMSESKQLLKG